MTTITLNIDNPESASIIRKLAKVLDGVTIQKSRKKRKSEVEEILEHMEPENFIEFKSREERIAFFENL